MGSRRRAREFALQMLYQIDLRDCTLDEALRNFWSGIPSQPDERAFAEQMVRGVLREQRDLDGRIENLSINWKISRMPLVDRNILRMGAYELLHMRDIPITVTLNEAIELGKRYSSVESGAFINGILDKVAKTVAPGLKVEPGTSGGSDEDEYLEDDEE